MITKNKKARSNLGDQAKHMEYNGKLQKLASEKNQVDLHELLERLSLLWGFSHAVRATWAKT